MLGFKSSRSSQAKKDLAMLGFVSSRSSRYAEKLNRVAFDGRGENKSTVVVLESRRFVYRV